MSRSRFGCHGGSREQALVEHMRRYVTETVTIFTTSGGPTGCGFTGVVLSVNSRFVRLLTDMGLPPAFPLSDNIFCEPENGPGPRGGSGLSKGYEQPLRTVGSVCDIPIDRIVAFCHNAV
jgi:hypothetical protein